MKLKLLTRVIPKAEKANICDVLPQQWPPMDNLYTYQW